ncbi:MAG: hypothetical protein ACHQF0_12880 [Chitinophagales bacterium]
MKKEFFFQKMFLLALMIIISTSNYAQQTITITAVAHAAGSNSPVNVGCNGDCVFIDAPELNNNPNAIISSVTPVLQNGVNPNPSTLSVGYNLNNSLKWCFINMGNQNIQNSAQFIVEYYAHPNTDQFVDTITNYLLVRDGSVIDHAGLNGNPNAQFKFIQNVTATPGSFYNLTDVEIDYVTKKGRWCIFNKDNTKVPTACKYNIAIIGGPGSAKTIPRQDSLVTVSGIKNISTSTTPVVGQVLKWNGTAWVPGNDSTCCPANNTNNGASGWSVNGANLYSSNQGFVGIAWKNPTAPLGFSPSLGKKISLYPGATGDVGFGVAGNRLQIFSDNPNADVAIGYDAAGTFNERFAVNGNGALAVNGNNGKEGQVLQSNGPENAATWVRKPYVFFLSSLGNTNFQNANVNSLDIKGLAGSTFTLDQESAVAVTFTGNIKATSCATCGDSYGFITIEIRNQATSYSTPDIGLKIYYVIRNGEIETVSGTRLGDNNLYLSAGTYTIYATINRDNNTRGEILAAPHDLQLKIEVFPS